MVANNTTGREKYEDMQLDKINNTNPTENWERTQEHRKCKQFMLAPLV
jgi:hypothetical protein